MTTSTQNLDTAEALLDAARLEGLGSAEARIQLAGAYIGLAAIKVTIETQAVLRAQMERDEY